MTARIGIAARATLVVLLAISVPAPARAQALPGGFAYLRDIDPSIIQDIRYATSNNFVGRPLAGYGAGECVVKREVGLRLKAVQEELAAQNLSLKMFDCYRPARASLGGGLVAVLRPLDHVERGPRRPVAVEHLEREILRGELLLHRLQPQPDFALHHAFTRIVAGERTADEIVGCGVADVLDDAGVDVAQINEIAGERLGVGG